MHVARAKRGKTRASKSPLVLVLLLIGRESGARFFNQSQSVAVQKPKQLRNYFRHSVEKRSKRCDEHPCHFYMTCSRMLVSEICDPAGRLVSQLISTGLLQNRAKSSPILAS